MRRGNGEQSTRKGCTLLCTVSVCDVGWVGGRGPVSPGDSITNPFSFPENRSARVLGPRTYIHAWSKWLLQGTATAGCLYLWCTVFPILMIGGGADAFFSSSSLRPPFFCFGYLEGLDQQQCQWALNHHFGQFVGHVLLGGINNSGYMLTLFINFFCSLSVYECCSKLHWLVCISQLNCVPRQNVFFFFLSFFLFSLCWIVSLFFLHIISLWIVFRSLTWILSFFQCVYILFFGYCYVVSGVWDFLKGEQCATKIMGNNSHVNCAMHAWD